MFDLSKYIIHDLTHTFDEKIAGYSDQPARTLSANGWNAKTLSIYSHAGTHMDAPFHFGVSEHTIDQYSPDEFMGKAWIIDVSVTKPKQLILLEDVISQLSNFQNGDSLLIRTDWSKMYEDSNFKPDLPRISEELANWCVKHKVKMLGVEPLSVADVEDLAEVTKIHQILLGGYVTIIEGLNKLDSIKSESVFLIALPLKIKNGDGAPARVIAFEER
ncbi:cyclase family protein [uncultured Arcticibacterium sp.]|uniref:cyclase family protein n=1 Tax=uncultured Arcticibacterium sp. TaxID=2173042 RepID=UPI0030F609BC